MSWSKLATLYLYRSKRNYEILNRTTSNKKMTTGIFKNVLRENGDLAGVFEFYGKTGYFYLCDLKVKNENKVVTGIRLFSGENTFSFNDEDIAIQWDKAQEKVGLFIRGYLWATIKVLKCIKW